MKERESGHSVNRHCFVLMGLHDINVARTIRQSYGSILQITAAGHRHFRVPLS